MKYINFVFIISGSTERQILSAIEEVVDISLPESKLANHFQDSEAAKLCGLKKITFCEARQKVIIFFRNNASLIYCF